jgi:hypothetical protein
VDLEPLEREDDVELVRELITRHAHYTGSELATRLLFNWTETAALFVKVMPRDYKRVLAAAALVGQDSGFGIATQPNAAVLVSRSNPKSLIANPGVLFG